MSANIYFIHCSDFTELVFFVCVTFLFSECDIHIKTCVQIHIYYIHNFGMLLTVLFYNQTTIIMDSIIRYELLIPRVMLYWSPVGIFILQDQMFPCSVLYTLLKLT